MTAALEGGEWSAAHPDRTLPPGKTRYPLYRRLGGPQGRSGRAENLVPTGIRSRTAQPVAQSLNQLSYPAHLKTKIHIFNIDDNTILCSLPRVYLRHLPGVNQYLKLTNTYGIASTYYTTIYRHPSLYAISLYAFSL